MIKINFNPEIDKEKTTRILREIRADKMSGFLDLPKKMYGSKELQRVKKIAEGIRA